MGSTASRPVSRNNLGIEGLVVTKLNPAGAFADPPGLIKFAVGESGSELFKAVERLTSTTVAIKIVSTSMQEKMTEIVSELRLVGTRRHLNLVAMHTCVLTTDSLWSVCEYMEFGAVADALQVLDMLEMSEAVMARILRDAAQGIAFLNSVGLAHRDIRSDNLLVNAQGITKLTDMSHAAPLPLRLEALSVNGDDSTAASTAAAAIQYTTSRPMGAIYWLSPEATQRKPCDMTVDMWALGIVAYELMEGQPPHMEFPELKALYLISTNGAPPLKQNPDRCWSNEIRAFVAECTRFDCRQRPIAQDVLDMSEFLAEDRCASHMEVVEMMKKAQALVEELE